MAKKQYKRREEETKEIVRPPQESVSQYLTHPITFLIGKPGTGKTDSATRIALDHMRHGADKIIVSRPQVECDGERMGFLPGPQPLDAKILTPSGWTTMGEIKEGDYVVSRDGKPTKVIGVFPKGVKDVFKVRTTDGRETECCEDHLWHTRTWEDKRRADYPKPGSVKSTREIIDTLKKTGYKAGKVNHYIPRNEPIQFNKNDLKIPPYVLGVILGDGSISGHISFSTIDLELKERMERELKTIGCYVTSPSNKNKIQYNIRADLYNHKTAKKVCLSDNRGTKEFHSVGIASKELRISDKTIAARCRGNKTVDGIDYKFLPKVGRYSHPLKEQLRILGLEGKKAWDKFIPNAYKYSSIEDRIDILRGLMDTDGSCKERTGEASYTTTSLRLAKDVIEIVQSLGGSAKIRERDRIGKTASLNIDGRNIITRRVSYEFTISMPNSINPFSLSRKANRFKKCKYMQFIGIESIEKVGQKEVQCIRVDNPEHLYITDDFIVTHNTSEEKLKPWLLPFRDVLTRILGDEEYAEKTLDTFELVPLALIRGRTIRNCTAILDEAQNCTKAQLLAFCTRLGQGGRIVITGDANQSDLHPSKQCFLKVADELVLAGVASIHVLTKNYRGEWIEKIENAFEKVK